MERLFDAGASLEIKEVYEAVMAAGVKDRGVPTRHSIRGMIHKLKQDGRIVRIGLRVYQKAP